MGELSGIRTGLLEEGERVTLSDPKGRRHSVLLRAGGTFHTTKGGIEHDALIGGLWPDILIGGRGVDGLFGGGSDQLRASASSTPASAGRG